MKDSQISVIEDEISKFEQSLSTVNESVIQVETLSNKEREELVEITKDLSDKLTKARQVSGDA